MGTLNPMLAQAGDEPFDSPDYIFDLKYNGMRIVGDTDVRSALLRGRSGADFTAKFPELAGLAKHFKTPSVQVDGEVVCLGQDGLPNFNALQHRDKLTDPLAIKAMMSRYPARYFIFELSRVGDYDLTAGASSQADQMQRREILEKIVSPSEIVHLSPFVDGNGTQLFEEVRRINEKAGRQVFDGVMAKTKTGLYYPGRRSPDWLKLKIPKFACFVICGYTFGTGWREDIMGAVVLGRPENGQLSWVGCAGSGFKHQPLRELYYELRGMNTQQSPFPNGTKVPKLSSWVKPVLVCEVKFYDVTKDGQLIWPIFQRLWRDIKPDSDIIGKSFDDPISEVLRNAG